MVNGQADHEHQQECQQVDDRQTEVCRVLSVEAALIVVGGAHGITEQWHEEYLDQGQLEHRPQNDEQ